MRRLRLTFIIALAFLVFSVFLARAEGNYAIPSAELDQREISNFAIFSNPNHWAIVEYERISFDEWYPKSLDGIEQSFWIDVSLPGKGLLVIECKEQENS